MIIKVEDFDATKINVHDPYDVNENILKIDLSVDKLKAVMLKIEDLSVLSFNDKNIILDLRAKESIKKIFDNIDSHVVSVIQERKITKRLKTKFNYRQLTSTYTNKDNNYDILSLNIDFNLDNFSTEIFEIKNKKLSHDNALTLLKNNAKVDLILEITGVIFNKEEGFIYLDNIVRQMKVRKIKPKRIEHLEYSFVDSEKSSSDNETDTEDENNNDKKYLSSESENINLKFKTDDDCLINNSLETDSEEDLDNNTSDLDE